MFDIFINVIAPYILEIIIVGALVEIIKKQWIIKFLYKNIKWWVYRLLPLIISIIICLIWRLEKFSFQEYLKAICICWSCSSLIYNFLEKILKGKQNEKENNNY